MEPMTTYDLVMNFLVVIIMPLLIVANLRNWGLKSPLNTYLWTENPTFMRVSLLVIGVLALFSAVSLLGHYGLLAPAVVEYAMPALGVPFLVLALVEIWLAVGALRKFLRTRRAGGTVA